MPVYNKKPRKQNISFILKKTNLSTRHA